MDDKHLEWIVSLFASDSPGCCGPGLSAIFRQINSRRFPLDLPCVDPLQQMLDVWAGGVPPRLEQKH